MRFGMTSSDASLTDPLEDSLDELAIALFNKSDEHTTPVSVHLDNGGHKGNRGGSNEQGQADSVLLPGSEVAIAPATDSLENVTEAQQENKVHMEMHLQEGDGQFRDTITVFAVEEMEMANEDEELLDDLELRDISDCEENHTNVEVNGNEEGSLNSNAQLNSTLDCNGLDIDIDGTEYNASAELNTPQGSNVIPPTDGVALRSITCGLDEEMTGESVSNIQSIAMLEEGAEQLIDGAVNVLYLSDDDDQMMYERPTSHSTRVNVNLETIALAELNLTLPGNSVNIDMVKSGKDFIILRGRGYSMYTPLQ